MRGGNAKHGLRAEDHERFTEVFCIRLRFISCISTSVTQLSTCPENLSSDMLIVSTPPSVCVLVWLCMSVMILCWIMCAHVGISSSLSVMARQNTHKPNSWDHQVTWSGMKICSCKYRACESSSRLQYVQTLEYIACFQLHLNFDHNKKKSQKVAMETRDYDYSVALVAVSPHCRHHS